MSESSSQGRRWPEHDPSISVPAATTDSSNPLESGQRFNSGDAERISNIIDEELKKELARRREAQRKEVKVMLLGQAESGKSTLQKQFQLFYASQTLDHERPSWRPIVYFNIIKAVRMILDELDYAFSLPSESSPVSSSPVSSSPVSSSPESSPTSPESQAEIAMLRSHLLPLVAIEDSLASELSGGISISGGRTGVYVRAGWQALVTPNRNWPVTDIRSPAKPPVVANLAARTLGNTKNEVEALWQHHSVRSLLKLRKLRLDESAPFFLDNIHRVAEPDYLPTTDDILNVRLQTLGVIEHIFDINLGGTNYNWKMYDVGGARGQRHAWVPYFDDATAIIFLAPLSAFDQYLEEDTRTNRIDDSLQLFTAICSNKLLKKSHLVLMLNKVDLLKRKLEAGIKVRKYITSYGERPNRYEEVSEYFRAHFIQVHKRKDISHRALYVHFTSMLDIKATQSIIINVGEAIIRSHIAQTGLA